MGQYGDMTNYDSTDLTKQDIPVYTGDTDATTRYHAGQLQIDIDPIYRHHGTATTHYFVDKKGNQKATSYIINSGKQKGRRKK